MSPLTPRAHLASPRAKAAFLLLLTVLVCFLPYFFPPRTPVVSISYITGYNNRLAEILFVLGLLLFALFARGELAAFATSDRTLPRRTLGFTTAAAALFCFLRRFHRSPQSLGSEAIYANNRLEMLLSGLHPYRQFEYAYGPAHLYLPAFFVHTFHTLPTTGFYLWWALQWVAGTAMLWATIRLIELPLARRTAVFLTLWLFELPNLVHEGTAYTPVRIIGSAFFLAALHWLAQRFRNPILLVAASLLAIVGALAISPEQGTGVFFGLCGWFALQLLPRVRAQSPAPPSIAMPAFCVFLAGAAAIFTLAARFGLFLSLATFSGGGYAYPLLPSPTMLLLLFVYVAAVALAARDLFAGRAQAISIPLALGGISMLPAALGRCDFFHVQFAAPAFLLGVCAIEAQPALRRWWTPLALVFVLLPGLGLPLIARFLHLNPIAAPVLASNDPASRVPPPQAPCTTLYRTPDIILPPNIAPAQACLQTGYFMDQVDVLTPAAIGQKIVELQSPANLPLLLDDVPLTDQILSLEDDPRALRLNELSPFTPPIRRAGVSYQPLIDFIQQNYLPDLHPIGPYRVWRPRARPASR